VAANDLADTFAATRLLLRLRPRLEFRDPLLLPRGLAMDRVLQPLQKLLEVPDSRLSRPNTILPGIAAGKRFGLTGHVGTAPDPTNPRDQSIKLWHGSPPARARGGNRNGRIPPALFLSHPADRQRTVPDLLTNQFELRLAFLLGSLPRALHAVVSPGGSIETIRFTVRTRAWDWLARAAEADAPSARATTAGI
jgi:hypothetical protein